MRTRSSGKQAGETAREGHGTEFWASIRHGSDHVGEGDEDKLRRRGQNESYPWAVSLAAYIIKKTKESRV